MEKVKPVLPKRKIIIFVPLVTQIPSIGKCDIFLNFRKILIL